MTGASLASFVLDGLENTVKSSKTTCEKSLVNNSFIKPAVKNGVVRYTDGFIIVTNSVKEIPLLKKTVKNFLLDRGIRISKEHIKVTPWKKNAKFDFLGFHFIT